MRHYVSAAARDWQCFLNCANKRNSRSCTAFHAGESGDIMRRQKRVEDSRTENTYHIMPKHINGYGRLFGGVLMQWIDEVAGTVARRHAGSIVTTACVDNLNFKAGAYLGNTIVLIGRMTYVGRTSMEVRVDTYVEDMDGTRKMINRAYEVLVAIDQNDQKQEVPGLIIETETEKAEWLGGEKRYALRKQRRKEGY